MNANRVLAWFLFLFVFLCIGTTANAQRSVRELLPLQDFLELWKVSDPQPDASQSPCYEKQVADLHAQLNLQKSLIVQITREEERADYKTPEPNPKILAEKQALRNAIQKYQKALEVVLRLRLAGIRIEGMHLIVEANGCVQIFLFQRSTDLAKWETLSEHTIEEDNLRISLGKSSKAAFYRIVPIIQDDNENGQTENTKQKSNFDHEKTKLRDYLDWFVGVDGSLPADITQ